MSMNAWGDMSYPDNIASSVLRVQRHDAMVKVVVVVVDNKADCKTQCG